MEKAGDAGGRARDRMEQGFRFAVEKEDAMRKLIWSVAAAGVLAAGVLGGRMMAFASADTTVQPGAVAPGFTLPSQMDTPVSLKDYRGKYVVLYFYPKDQTSGCTLEAHNFERDKDKYAALNAVVLGVSLDTVESHKTFCTKDGLNFKLLADPDHKVIDEYGVPILTVGANKYARRETFLIGPDGKVLKVWDVKGTIAMHSEDVLAAIAEMKK